MNIDDLTYGQIKEIAALFGKSETQPEQNLGRTIVIGSGGNVVVGDLVIRGCYGYMKNASVIRRWGTSKGLGQLALNGPTSQTILDSCGEFTFHVETTCGLIPVKSDL